MSLKEVEARMYRLMGVSGGNSRLHIPTFSTNSNLGKGTEFDRFPVHNKIECFKKLHAIAALGKEYYMKVPNNTGDGAEAVVSYGGGFDDGGAFEKVLQAMDSLGIPQEERAQLVLSAINRAYNLPVNVNLLQDSGMNTRYAHIQVLRFLREDIVHQMRQVKFEMKNVADRQEQERLAVNTELVLFENEKHQHNIIDHIRSRHDTAGRDMRDNVFYLNYDRGDSAMKPLLVYLCDKQRYFPEYENIFTMLDQNHQLDTVDLATLEARLDSIGDVDSHIREERVRRADSKYTGGNEFEFKSGINDDEYSEYRDLKKKQNVQQLREDDVKHAGGEDGDETARSTDLVEENEVKKNNPGNQNLSRFEQNRPAPLSAGFADRALRSQQPPQSRSPRSPRSQSPVQPIPGSAERIRSPTSYSGIVPHVDELADVKGVLEPAFDSSVTKAVDTNGGDISPLDVESKRQARAVARAINNQTPARTVVPEGAAAGTRSAVRGRGGQLLNPDNRTPEKAVDSFFSS